MIPLKQILSKITLKYQSFNKSINLQGQREKGEEMTAIYLQIWKADEQQPQQIWES